jgi:polyphosphate glucokinase
MNVLGIDIGGSGIKGAPVDLETGKLLADRIRIKTPKKAEPEPVAVVVAEIARSFDWKGSIGVGFPAPIKAGVTLMAANVSDDWVGVNADDLLKRTTGCDCTMINDADAAGLAEMKYGAGKEHRGTVIMITLGTGIGTSLFHRGNLLPNTEFGHLTIDGKEAEHLASDAARQNEDLSWSKYSKRLNTFLFEMERLFWPDLFIIGGGISKKNAKYIPLLKIKTPVVPARFLNEAGIVGAALAVMNIENDG